MDENTSLDQTKRQTINPLVDEINKATEPLLKAAVEEFGFELPLAFRLYNQIRFYEEFGKLKMGTSVASKETLATQFGVTVKEIDDAFHNLGSKYKLGLWVNHAEPVFRNVTRTWMSNVRYKKHFDSRYTVTPKLGSRYGVTPKPLHGNTKAVTREHQMLEVAPLSENKKKVSESKTLLRNGPTAYGNVELNKMFEYWHKTTGLAITARTIPNRRAASNLLKKYGPDRLGRLIEGVAAAQSDQYAPRIADFTQLQNKVDELILWGKKKATIKKGVVI